MIKCTNEFCTPAPLKAIRDSAGINIGKFGRLLIAKRIHPSVARNIEKAEQILGPQESRIIPNSNGPIELKKVAIINITKI